MFDIEQNVDNCIRDSMFVEYADLVAEDSFNIQTSWNLLIEISEVDGIGFCLNHSKPS